MTDKVQKIREEVEMVINRRLNLLNGDYFDLNKEADGFTNEIMDIIDSLQEEPVSEELEKAAIDICSKVLKGETITIDGYEYVVLSDAEECLKAGAKWQKRRIVKEIKSRLVDAATNQDNSADIGEQTYYNGMVDALGRLRDKFMED